MDIRKIIREEVNSCSVKAGDMFHVQNRPTYRPTILIHEISPDCKWVRWFSVLDSEASNQRYMDKKIRDWEGKPFNASNATSMEQVMKNIENGFWVSWIGGPDEFDSIFESEELDWIKDVEPIKERFFDVYVCGDTEYDEETGEDECLDGGSYFLRIPMETVGQIWDGEVGDFWIARFGGPGDEGLGVIEWGEENNMFDQDDYRYVEYVREVSKGEFCRAVGHSNEDICYEHISESNDFDWIEDITQKSMNNLYVLDVKDVGVKPLKWLLDDLQDLGYGNTRGVSVPDACYIYMEKYKGDFVVAWDGCHIDDPTHDGKYEMLTPQEFDEYFYVWKVERDKGYLNESDFDWIEEVDLNPIEQLEAVLSNHDDYYFERINGNEYGEDIIEINDSPGGGTYFDLYPSSVKTYEDIIDMARSHYDEDIQPNDTTYQKEYNELYRIIKDGY